MADCNQCGGAPAVPYIVHEGEMARMERTNRRLWIAVVVLIAALFASCVCGMIHADCAPDKCVQEVYLHGTEGTGTA